MRQLWVLFLTVILAGTDSGLLEASQKDAQEDGQLRAGLIARYSVGDRFVERIDAEMAFDWGTSAPDSRLPTGGFRANWQGQLLIRQPGQYRLHVFLEGRVRVLLDGREVLTASAATASWHSGESFELPFGERALRVEFTRTGARARLMLCWSSKEFPLEPVPVHLLFRSAPRRDLDKIELGRQLFASHRCNRCHQRANDPPALPGPDLTAATVATDHRALVAQIVDPGRGGPHARMPRMGFQEVEAEAIVGWLAARARRVSLPPMGPVKAQDRAKHLAAGQLLLQSLGCLACHRVGNRGGAGVLAAPDLSQVGRRRSPAWLATWLKDPALLNRDHRMPVFALSDAERTQLVLALSALGGPFPGSSIKGRPEQVRRGEELVKAAECARCHRLPIETVASSTSRNDLFRVPADWSESCLDETPDRKRWRPAAGGKLSKSQREAVRAFVVSRSKTGLSPRSAFDRGRRVLEQRNCLTCHPRGTARGNTALAGETSKQVAILKGQSQALIPPSLTSVGDKLVDEALVRAIAGRQKRVRLPWLKIRMPRFEHTSQDSQALAAFLVASDRIPAGAPATPRVAARPRDESMLVLGQELVGAKGFSCIACHRVGTYVPRNVALGTRGSDLANLAGRLRREYFLRWCRSPLRIVPGMEMPSYIKAVPGLLGESADRQLAATWDALNDSRFQPPTNPTAVEQFLVVAAGGRTRVVRDVFTNPESNGGGTIARGLAVGFSNGHNLLFDLDVGRVALWTFGDFARQRTQGKSWFWDMAGSR